MFPWNLLPTKMLSLGVLLLYVGLGGSTIAGGLDWGSPGLILGQWSSLLLLGCIPPGKLCLDMMDSKHLTCVLT